MDWKGIRFYKVEAESKKDENFSRISINLNLDRMERIGTKEARIDFSYQVDYKPDVASLRFDGYVTVGSEKADIDKLLDDWKKGKTVQKSTAEALINIIRFNAETNGVLVAKALGIVPPVLAPKIEITT